MQLQAVYASQSLRFASPVPGGYRQRDHGVPGHTAPQDIALAELPTTHPIRLGLALNFSMVYYEILNPPDRACDHANQRTPLCTLFHHWKHEGHSFLISEESEQGSSARSFENGTPNSTVPQSVFRSSVDPTKEKSSEATSMISKLIEEKMTVVQQNQKLRQELDLLCKESSKSNSGFSITFLMIVVSSSRRHRRGSPQQSHTPHERNNY
ncbi:hypothetical protein ACQ4PT_053091 [Festuca glaucescens]